MLVYRIWNEIENKKQDGFKKIEWVKIECLHIACIYAIVKFTLRFLFFPLYIITKQGLSFLFVNALTVIPLIYFMLKGGILEIYSRLQVY